MNKKKIKELMVNLGEFLTVGLCASVGLAIVILFGVFIYAIYFM